jgi:hypothetical protein
MVPSVRLVFVVLCSVVVVQSADTWNYKENGKDWSLGVCLTGSEQSPIDIPDDVEDVENDDAYPIVLSNLADFSGDGLTQAFTDYDYEVRRNDKLAFGHLQAYKVGETAWT